MIVLNYIPLGAELDLDQLHKHSSKIAVELEAPRDIAGADMLPHLGPVRILFDELQQMPQPEAGNYNIFVIRENDYEWNDRLAPLASTVDRCSRNQVLVIKDEATALAQVQHFHNLLVDELTRGLVDPVFGLDSKVLVRFTLLAVEDAPVEAEAFRNDYEQAFEPVKAALSSILPIQTIFQVPSYPSSHFTFRIDSADAVVLGTRRIR